MCVTCDVERALAAHAATPDEKNAARRILQQLRAAGLPTYLQFARRIRNPAGMNALMNFIKVFDAAAVRLVEGWRAGRIQDVHAAFEATLQTQTAAFQAWEAAHPPMDPVPAEVLEARLAAFLDASAAHPAVSAEELAEFRAFFDKAREMNSLEIFFGRELSPEELEEEILEFKESGDRIRAREAALQAVMSLLGKGPPPEHLAPKPTPPPPASPAPQEPRSRLPVFSNN